jgi:predicted DNA-binding transcriptional regulator YafY
VRADRLLSIVMLLQVHSRLTSGELADRLEVSVRTVLRDMDALSAAGIPVLAERGRSGGWSLDRAWRTNLTGLNAQELSALFLAQPPRVLADLGLAGAADQALVKLQASLPAVQRQRAALVRERLHVDLSGWTAHDDPGWLSLVQEAVWQDRRLAIRYSTARGETIERSVDPLGLVAKGSAWYLVARTDDGLRTYRVGRIAEACLLEDTFERPLEFDLAAYWKHSSADLMGRRPTYEATLRVDPKVAWWLQTWGGLWKVDFSSRPDERGWLIVDIRFEREREACFVVLGLGSRAEVVAPESLRALVRAEAALVADRTRDPA